MKSNEERVKSILKKVSDYKMKKRREGYALVTCICAVLVAVVVGLDATTVVPDKENVDCRTDIDSETMNTRGEQKNENIIR